MLTPGQAHDLACAEPLIDNADPDALLGDKAYDADSFVDTLTQRGITPVIPPKANRKSPRECDFALYCEPVSYTHLDVYKRQAQGVDERVNFGGQSTARSADRLRAVFFRAPALC